MPTLKIKIKSPTDNVNKIADKISDRLLNEPKEKVAVIKMACSEFLENLIKYADFEKNKEEAIIQITLTDVGKVKIITKNEVKSEKDIEKVKQYINETVNTGDKFKLYTSQLEELQKSGSQQEGVGFGLYRIAYEGNFTLACQSNGMELMILAERDFEVPSKFPQLKTDEMEIKLTETDASMMMEWIGKCRLRNPSNVLGPYLEGVMKTLIGKKFSCDFSELEYINSSTVPSIIKFFQLLENNSVKSTFYYNSSVSWQISTFTAFKTIVKTMKCITIEGK
jgi:anti-sigma regulatory factor (Ser/Thr protein kinase)